MWSPGSPSDRRCDDFPYLLYDDEELDMRSTSVSAVNSSKVSFIKASGRPMTDEVEFFHSGRGAPHADVGGNGNIDIVDEWGSQSFPASDPPQNW